LPDAFTSCESLDNIGDEHKLTFFALLQELQVVNDEKLENWCNTAEEARRRSDLDSMTACGVRLQYYGKIRLELEQWGGLGNN